jgi:hypothetical protein
MQEWQSAPVVGQQPTAQPAPQPSTIGGRRVIGDVPPSERRADRDQQLQEVTTAQSLQNDAVRTDIAQQGEQRQQQQFEQGNVSEQQAAFLLDRVGGGIDDLNFVIKNMPGGKGAPSAVDAVLYNSFGPNSIVTRGMTESGRKAVEDVQLDILDALLTLGTGAAYNAEQLQGQRAAYFPQFNDDEPTVALKRRRLERLFNNAKVRAGPLGERLDQYRGQFLGASEQDAPDTMGIGLGGEAAQGYGDDGRGNPLVMGDGQVLLGYENDAPLYGPFGKNQTVDPRAAELYRRIQRDQEMRGEGGGMDVAKAGVTLGLSDEAAGVGEAIGRALTGDLNVGQNFEAGRASENFRIEQGREDLGALAVPVELLGAGGALRSVGAFGQARQAVQSVRNRGLPVNRANVQGAMTRRAAVEGAGVGTLAGGAQGDTLQERGTNALLGGTVGLATGGLVQAGGNALANRAAAAPVAAGVPQRASDLAAASNRVGFNRLNRAMVDPQSNNAVTKADASIVGGRIVQREMQAAADEFTDVVGQNLGAGGRVVDDVARGDVFKNASERWIKETGQIANRRYTRAEQLAGDVKVAPTTARAAAREMVLELSQASNTNSAEVAYLRGLLEDFGKSMSPATLRNMRTTLRKRIAKGDLVFGQSEARVLEIMDAAANDIRAGLTAAGKPEAARAFDLADRAYAGRMQYISGTLQKLVGGRNSNLNAAQVAKKVDSLSTTDYNEFRKVYAMLEPEERLDMAATMAQQLGRKSNQTTDAPFSIDTFLTNTSKMDEPAIRAVFGDDGVQAVKDLRAIGKEIARVRGAMNSRTSKSGVASYRDWLFSMIGTAGPVVAASGNMSAGALAAGTGAAATAGWQGFSARALMSPNLTKWLRQAPKTSNPRAIDAHFNRLAEIGRIEPAIAGQIAQFRQAVMAAANDNPASRLAAENEQPVEPQ